MRRKTEQPPQTEQKPSADAPKKPRFIGGARAGNMAAAGNIAANPPKEQEKPPTQATQGPTGGRFIGFKSDKPEKKKDEPTTNEQPGAWRNVKK